VDDLRPCSTWLASATGTHRWHSACSSLRLTMHPRTSCCAGRWSRAATEPGPQTGDAGAVSLSGRFRSRPPQAAASASAPGGSTRVQGLRPARRCRGVWLIARPSASRSTKVSSGSSSPRRPGHGHSSRPRPSAVPPVCHGAPCRTVRVLVQLVDARALGHRAPSRAGSRIAFDVDDSPSMDGPCPRQPPSVGQTLAWPWRP